MTHIRDVSRIVQVGVHPLHEGQLDVLLLAEAAHNVCELNELTAAMDIILLSSHLQHIVIDVTAVGRGGGGRGEGRRREREREGKGRKAQGEGGKGRRI